MSQRLYSAPQLQEAHALPPLAPLAPLSPFEQLTHFSPHDPFGALYVHLPFCASRCNYCDFTTRAIALDSPEIDTYIERLVRELRRFAKAGEFTQVKTVYIGGGTPTFVGMRRLTALLYALSVSVDLAQDGFEFTLEANPESLDERLVCDLWAMGVNRLSIGVQSLDDDVLRLLGRPHNAAAARTAIAAARTRFENVSVDVMCGIPGQTTAALEHTLVELVETGVAHVSVYPLTIEPHTPFERMMRAGALSEIDEDAQAEHMLAACNILEARGFHRYEVASYARPGFECRHNSAYWTGVPYAGIGRGAASMIQNAKRRLRIYESEVTDDLTRAEREAEDLMLGMRLARGVSHERVAEAQAFLPQARVVFAQLIAAGFVIDTGTRFKPTQQGWLCGNELFSRLLDLA